MYEFNSLEQLKNFIASEVIETSEAASLLGCSRQYIDQLIREGKITPVKRLTKNKLFLKSEIIKKQAT